MGVRVLARSTTTTLATLEDRLKAVLGAPSLQKSKTRWKRQCVYHLPRSAESGLRELFVLQSSESAIGEQYIVSSSERSGVRVLRAGPEISTVIEATNTHTQRLKVTIEGVAHPCGDFVVRLGQLFLNGSLAGVAVEAEYLPCALASAAGPCAPLHAFLDLLLPEEEGSTSYYSSAKTECFSGVTGLPAAFSEEHGALLLVGLMREKLLPTAFAGKRRRE